MRMVKLSMRKLIDSIKHGSQITIKGTAYHAFAKVYYVTESDTANWYAKVQLEDHHVLVLSPADNHIYFGQLIDPIENDFPNAETIEYRNAKYDKVAQDYQLVKEFVFGDYLSMEGEVLFADYESSATENNFISQAVISRTGERADIIATLISREDIVFGKGPLN